MVIIISTSGSAAPELRWIGTGVIQPPRPSPESAQELARKAFGVATADCFGASGHLEGMSCSILGQDAVASIPACPG